MWPDKYRPKELSELICTENIRIQLQKCIDDQEINHMLLWGPPGTGKTSMAKLLIDKIDCDKLVLNGSDENSVEVVRNKINGFASTVPFRKIKMVFIDEMDYMSIQSQAILRNLMEKCYKSTRFIGTANYTYKIINPLVSRFQDYEVKHCDRTQIRKRIDYILNQESVEIDNENDINDIINKYYPDIRKIINTIEQSVKR